MLALLVLVLHPLPRLKMCTVSCALPTASRVPTTLKLSEYILARPAGELVQLLRARDASRTDDGALLRDRREKHAGAVQCMRGDGRLVRTDDQGDD